VRLDLDTERRRGRLAGAAALGSVACWLGALVAANAGGAGGAGGGFGSAHPAALGQPSPFNRALQLTEFHRGIGTQALATALRCAGLLLTALVAAYLYGIVRARRPQASRRWMLGSAIAGAGLVAAATVFGFVALGHVAAAFTAGGPRTVTRAQHLMDASTALRLAAVCDLVSRLVFALWIAIVSLEMMRTGLLDRFLAYWGLGAAGALVLLPIGDAMFVGWLGSVGIMALGYWPGGRPEAWRPMPVPL
jgi:hypothetical protein